MPANLKNNDVIFEPEKIRKALGYFAESVHEGISDTGMDSK